MWLTDAMSAVNVIINVLVPTAVFNAMPKKTVKTINKIGRAHV